MIVKPTVVVTQDGSNTLVHPVIGSHYHSTFGAKQESDFIFIQEGLDFYLKNIDLKPVSILEMGFGSGLNAYNSLLYSQNNNVDIHYVGIEKYPIDPQVVSTLEYPKIFKAEETALLFHKIHHVLWEENVEISGNFTLKKQQVSFEDVELNAKFDIIYFDAFSPEDQPELWTKTLFQKMYNALNSKGILVTYCSKGIVKQALRAVGFKLKRLPGPPSKRHILRAQKV